MLFRRKQQQQEEQSVPIFLLLSDPPSRQKMKASKKTNEAFFHARMTQWVMWCLLPLFSPRRAMDNDNKISKRWSSLIWRLWQQQRKNNMCTVVTTRFYSKNEKSCFLCVFLLPNRLLIRDFFSSFFCNHTTGAASLFSLPLMILLPIRPTDSSGRFVFSF